MRSVFSAFDALLSVFLAKEVFFRYNKQYRSHQPAGKERICVMKKLMIFLLAAVLTVHLIPAAAAAPHMSNFEKNQS